MRNPAFVKSNAWIEAQRHHATEQEYYDWVASEPLSDPAVDAENCAHIARYSLHYWDCMLAAGKDAVAMRKEEGTK